MLVIGSFKQEGEEKEQTKEYLEGRSEQDLLDDIYDSMFYNKIDRVKRDLNQKIVNQTYGEKSWLSIAVELNSFDSVKYIVEDLKSFISVRSFEMMQPDETALHVAAKMGRTEMVKYLLEKGINKKVKNASGETAEEVAKTEEIEKIIQEFDVNKVKEEEKVEVKKEEKVEEKKVEKVEEKKEEKVEEKKEEKK